MELGRWPESKALVMGMVADPPSSEDARLLNNLCMLAYLQQDPDADRMREILLALDPESDPLAGLPRPPGVVEPQPMRAVVRDDRLQVSAELAALPEDEQRAHLMAAIVAGGPNGHELLDELSTSDPPLAERVMSLLGLRRVTPEQAAVPWRRPSARRPR